MNKKNTSKGDAILFITIYQFLIKFIRRTLKFIFLLLTKPKEIISVIKKKEQTVYEIKLNQLWSEQKYILLNLAKVDSQFYKKYIRIKELEHQVGRYLNMKSIIDEIKNENI